MAFCSQSMISGGWAPNPRGPRGPERRPTHRRGANRRRNPSRRGRGPEPPGRTTPDRRRGLRTGSPPTDPERRAPGDPDPGGKGEDNKKETKEPPLQATLVPATVHRRCEPIYILAPPPTTEGRTMSDWVRRRSHVLGWYGKRTHGRKTPTFAIGIYKQNWRCGEGKEEEEQIPKITPW